MAVYPEVFSMYIHPNFLRRCSCVPEASLANALAVKVLIGESGFKFILGRRVSSRKDWNVAF